MSQTYSLRSFAFGEVSMKASGRTDLTWYPQACKSLINMFAYPIGYAEKRPGTRYAATAKTLGSKVKLFRWKLTQTSYITIEAGDEYFRFYKEGAPIMDGASPYELTSPWGEEDLSALHMLQVGTIAYFVHEDYAPRKLTYTSDTSWAFSTPTFTAGVGEETFGSAEHYPALVEIFQDRLIFAKTTTQPGTFWGSRTSTYENFMLRRTAVVTAPVASPGVVYWTGHGLSVNDSVSFTTTGALPTGLLPGVAYYVLEAGYTADSFRVAATPGGTAINFTGSTSGVHTGWATPPLATDAWEKTPQAQASNEMLWMLAEESLLFGTSEGTFKAASKGEALNPDVAWWPTRQTANGTSNVEALMIDDFACFVSKDGKRVFRFQYQDTVDKYVADDITQIASHITSAGVAGMAHQREPATCLWIWTTDGKLATAQYDRAASSIAWNQMDVGGLVESVCIIPTDGEDQVWISVVRTIEDVEYRYIEYFSPRGWEETKDYNGVDSAYLWDGGDAVGVTEITALDYPFWEEGTIYNTGDVVLKRGISEYYTSLVDNNTSPVSSSDWLAMPYTYTVAVVTANGHGFEDDDLVRFLGVEGLEEPNGEVFTVKNKTADTFELYSRDGSSMCNFGGPTPGSGGTVEKVTNTISGLDWLEGKTVRSLGDGSQLPDEVVVGGALTLDDYANKIFIGIPFTAHLEPLPVSETRNKLKSIKKVFAMFYQTADAKIGPSTDLLESVILQDGEPMMDEAPSAETTMEYVFTPGYADYDGLVVVESDAPLPMTILSLMYEMTVGQ